MKLYFNLELGGFLSGCIIIYSKNSAIWNGAYNMAVKISKNLVNWNPEILWNFQKF